ncbi:MAG: SpoIID/LytB domain-containing protein [Eubacteriales bacterium]
MKKNLLAFLAALIVITFAIPANAAVFRNDIRVLISTATYTSMSITVVGDYYIKEAPDFDLDSDNISIWIEGDRPVIRTDNDSFSAATITLISPDYSGTSAYVGFYNANYGYCSYLGHMQFTSNEGSIRAINTLPTENYLYGVVPHEMSNRFPLESLKAQAVCARSYATTKCFENRDLTFDVLDTFDHQVYRGYTSSYARAVSAVDATKGQVLTDKGTIIQAFYTASNGGQTELTGNVWNENLPYYLQKDDIFDLANPYSPEQKTFIPAEFTDETKKAMDNTVLSILQTNANLLASDSVTLLSVVSVKATGPIYAAPSRSYSGADITMMVSKSDGSVGQLTVSLNFDDLIISDANPSGIFNTELYLKMRGVEKVTGHALGLESEADGWYLTNRRYGHGIGLSQRGAQQRALSGLSYQDILSFYYDNTKLITFEMGKSSDAIMSEKYKITDDGVVGVDPGVATDDFITSFSTNAGTLSIVSPSSQTKTDGPIVTGDMVRCVNSDQTAIIDLPVIIYGDISGDGAITSRDLNLLQWHLLGTRPLTGAYLSAADINKDGRVQSDDLLALIWHLNGKKRID